MPTLDWLTRDQDLTASSRVPYRLLEAVPELSYGDPATENMIIQGDNLDALKALLPVYAGQVKCIYADPPFTTDQTFPDYSDTLKGTQWLGMIYPRLDMFRDLLSEDGTLFVHIDDNQLGNLLVVCDEIFGRENRKAVVTFKQGAATGHKSINPGPVNVSNFLLIYARNRNRWKPRRLFTGRERDVRYNQFLTNRDAPMEHWKFTTLSGAFASSLGLSAKVVKKTLGDDLEDKLSKFVLEHADRVAQFVRPSRDAVSEEARNMIDASLSQPKRIFKLERSGFSDMYFLRGQRIIFYEGKLKLIDGELVAGETLTNLWTDLLSNNLHAEGEIAFPKSKKPEALIKRCLDLSTTKGDIVLDAFLGSGTTAAASQKMGRTFIGIEDGTHAETKCAPRLMKVIDGEQSGISKAVGWAGGGGFRFLRLGAPIFDENGNINPKISFVHLAAHIWFTETHTPLLKPRRHPKLGIHNGTALYLLYNGILRDRRPESGNVLTRAVLAALDPHDGPRIVYGESSRLAPATLKRLNIAFKQTPYDVRAR